MRVQFAAVVSALVVTAAASSAAASINPEHYLDPVAFHALGDIVQTVSFGPANPDAITHVSNPLISGGLTFTSGENVIVGKNTSFQPIQNAIANNLYSPFPITINGAGYTMFAFSIGNLFGDAHVTVDIFTNAGNYAQGAFSPPSNEGFQFHGYLAPDGEYFTGFNIKANDELTAIAFSQFELGYADAISNAVPEPATWGLMILGFAAVGASLRARRRLSVA